MKKLLPLVFVFSLVIPQVTYAAWWNPISWSIFHRDNIKISTDELLKMYSPKATTTSKMTKFYIKYDNSRVRTCASANCSVLGYYKKNDFINLDGQLSLKDLNEWVEVGEVPGKIGYLNKSVLSETPQANTEIIQPKNNEVSSKDVLELIDTMISGQQSDILYIGEHYSTHVDYYINWASRGKKLVTQDNETDLYLRNNYKYVYDLFDYVINASDKVKNSSEGGDYSIQGLLKFVDERYSYLRKLKSEIPQYYPNEDIKKAALLRLIESSSSYKKSMIDRTYYGNDMYLKAVKNAMDKIDETMEEIGAYLSRQKPSDRVIERTINQYIAVPQIQMPKTTYCTMSGGLGGHYSIICN
jgi:hypothetical protein